MSLPAGEPGISRTRGILLFVLLVAVGATVVFLAFRSSPDTASSRTGGDVPLAAPSSTPQPGATSAPAPTTEAPVTPTPTRSAKPDPQRTEFLTSHVPTDAAMAIALAVTELDWRSTPQRSYLRVQGLLAPALREQVRGLIESQDWAGCAASKCVIVPEATKVVPTANGGRNWSIAVTVTPYLNGKTAQPTRTITVVMSLSVGGAWQAVDVQVG